VTVTSCQVHAAVSSATIKAVHSSDFAQALDTAALARQSTVTVSGI
jgi:hypothetical protein